MRIVIAPDAYKECLSAEAVAEALAEGWRTVFPRAAITLIPMADGGEGTVEALVAATGGRYIEAGVTSPMGTPVAARYGLLGDGNTAILEMAAASGLPLVSPEQRNPEIATTYGTGEMIRHALDQGAARIIVGIGGSATNDGGAGMAQALGYRLLDAQGQELPWGGTALARLAHIDTANCHPRLKNCEVLVACDVDNPLCGPKGASRIYGPQKGASPEAVERLDAALRHFGALLELELGISVLETPGAGAAGGLGAGLMAFAGGILRRGVELVAEACGLEQQMAGANLVITGEGRLDAQSAHGKTPVGVARVAQRLGIPVVAVAGTLGQGYESVLACGINAAFSICPGPIPYENARDNAAEYLKNTASNIARLWASAHRE